MSTAAPVESPRAHVSFAALRAALSQATDSARSQLHALSRYSCSMAYDYALTQLDERTQSPDYTGVAIDARREADEIEEAGGSTSIVSYLRRLGDAFAAAELARETLATAERAEVRQLQRERLDALPTTRATIGFSPSHSSLCAVWNTSTGLQMRPIVAEDSMMGDNVVIAYDHARAYLLD